MCACMHTCVESAVACHECGGPVKALPGRINQRGKDSLLEWAAPPRGSPGMKRLVAKGALLACLHLAGEGICFVVAGFK